MEANEHTFQLPYTVSTLVELKRLLRETEVIDEALRQASIRKGGSATSLPKASGLLNEVVETNGLNLLQAGDRKQLIQSLKYIQGKAPTIHISFSVDPSAAFLRQLVTWLRNEIHPFLFVRIGLQPSIGAGCIVRTPNKYFDLSLRERFNSQKNLLIEKINQPAAQVGEQQAKQPAEYATEGNNEQPA